MVNSGVSAVLFIILLATGAWAQSAGPTTGKIVGAVKDAQGAALAGALVSARQLETNLERGTQTDEKGLYQLLQLPPGRYAIKAAAEGFTPHAEELRLTIGTTALLEFQLNVAGSSDTIVVRAANEFGELKTESSTNIVRESIDALPINQRNFLDFARTAARVTTDRLPPQGAVATSGLSVNGQSARFNNITIDGLDNNDLTSGSVRSTFSQDAVQEFQVVSDSYSAEFGRALGGIINIVTRRGGNDYHGSLFGFARNDVTSARDPFSAIEPEYRQYQFGATASGPIKKDRAFFFTSFERLSIKQNNIVLIDEPFVRAANAQGFNVRSGPVPFPIGTTTVLARADLQVNANDSIWVRYNGGFTYHGAFETFGGLTAESSGGILDLDDNTLAVNNTYINPGLNLVNETRFLYGRRNQIIRPMVDGPQIRIATEKGIINLGRSFFTPQLRAERIYQIVNNVTIARGRQQIKFGVDFSYIDTPEGKTGGTLFANGVVFFAPIDFGLALGNPTLPLFSALQSFDPSTRTPDQRSFLTLLARLLPRITPGFPMGVPLADLPLPNGFLQGFGDTSLEVPVKQLSLFFQDDIKFGNLLVKAGVRYDFTRVRFFPDNSGNFSPRVALAYRPVERVNLHAGYGLFFGGSLFGPATAAQTTATRQLQIPIILFPFSVLTYQRPTKNFPEGNSLPAGVNFVPQLSFQFAVQPDLRPSYTQQINAGIDLLVERNSVLSINYDFVRGIKLFAVRNINPIVRRVPNNAIQSQLTGRVDTTRGNVFEFESAFDSYYHALTVSYNRRFANRFALLASYTFSKGLDNFIDFRNELQQADDPLRLDLERGYSLQDVRNRFVLSGNWELSYTRNPVFRGFQLSTIINIESGRPFNLIAGTDLNGNGDNPAGDRPRIGGVPIARNAGITPGFANVDVRVTRVIAINDRVKVQGFVELFNLFNRVNISTVNSVYMPDRMGNFVLPEQENGRFIASEDRFRSAFAPRQVQFGFRMNF